jgi:hypothetical protein
VFIGRRGHLLVLESYNNGSFCLISLGSIFSVFHYPASCYCFCSGWVFFWGLLFYLFSFMFLSFLVVSLLCSLGRVTRCVFDTFLWCCVGRGNLLSFRVFLFLITERCAVSVVIAWAAWAARLGVGAISPG